MIKQLWASRARARARAQSWRVLVPATVVLAGGAGIAVAAIPNKINGVITSCYQLKQQTRGAGGELRVIDAQAGAKCKKGEKRLTFNRRGPAGANGKPGPQGAKGDTGPRAYGHVTCARTPPFACTLNTLKDAKGVIAVTNPAKGAYCISVPGVDGSRVPLVAAVDYHDTTSPPGNATVMPSSTGCGSAGNGFDVRTARQPSVGLDGAYAAASGISFTFVVP